MRASTVAPFHAWGTLPVQWNQVVLHAVPYGLPTSNGWNLPSTIASSASSKEIGSPGTL